MIKVCDVIMGGGKTCAAINYMNEDTEHRFIYITPFLNEVERIKDGCKDRHFTAPEYVGGTKMDSLHYLLERKRNIASTHALFKRYNAETIRLLKEGNYKLILDEVIDVVEKIPVHKDDIDLLLTNEFIRVEDDFSVTWLNEQYEGEFKHLEAMSINKNLFLYHQTLMLWVFPPEVFKAFNEVIVLTYMFKAQIQRYYFDMYQLEYRFIGTVRDKSTGQYYFSENGKPPAYVKELKNRVHVLDDKKLNAIGEGRYALSVSWFEKSVKQKEKPRIKALKNNLTNLFINRYKSPSNNNLWTTFRSYRGQIRGKGYTNGFVPCNIRSTNAYQHKTHLAYCVNIYFNPFLKNYFLQHGVDVMEDEYALSEMVQWIWRSAIRRGDEVWIYVPSKRMRTLLTNWLEDLATTDV